MDKREAREEGHPSDLEEKHTLLHTKLLVDLQLAFDKNDINVLRTATQRYLKTEYVPHTLKEILDRLEVRDLLGIGNYAALKNIFDIARLMNLKSLAEQCEREVTHTAESTQDEEGYGESLDENDEEFASQEGIKKEQIRPRMGRGQGLPQTDGVPVDKEQPTTDQNPTTILGISGDAVPSSASRQTVHSPTVNSPRECNVNQYGSNCSVSNVFQGVPARHEGLLQGLLGSNLMETALSLGTAVTTGQEGISNQLPFGKENVCFGDVYCKQCSRVCCYCCSIGNILFCDFCGFWRNAMKCSRCKCSLGDHVGVQCERDDCNGGQRGAGPHPRGTRN